MFSLFQLLQGRCQVKAPVLPVNPVANRFERPFAPVDEGAATVRTLEMLPGVRLDSVAITRKILAPHAGTFTSITKA